MRYLSVCSGIEAATVAWRPLGWVPVGFAEIEGFPSKVLAHRYGSNMPGDTLSGNAPPNFGDFTAIPLDRLGRVGLLVGGTPCQAFSVAGRRLSLADARGNLSLAFAVLAHELAGSHGLRWALWENVPGVLSTDDNAFGCLLGGLVGADDPLPLPRRIERWPDAGLVAGPRARAAWRVLDAQYFGLAQRRRRVFVVVGFGAGCDPAAVLFEPQSLRRHPPARGKAGEGAACGTLGGTSPSGGWRFGVDEAAAGHVIATVSGEDVAPCLIKSMASSVGNTQDAQIIGVAATLRARDGAKGVDSDCTDTLVAHSLRGEGFDASEDGTGRGTPLVPVCFDTTQITSRENRSSPQPGEPCHPLAAGAQPPAIAFDCKAGGDTSFSIGELPGSLRGAGHGGGHAAIASQGRGSNIDLGQEVTGTLGTNAGSVAGAPCVASSWAVRRLTPTECHRLQGFPDDHCAIPGAADGPQYKALGNSMAVAVMAWIGARIAVSMSTSKIGR